jgi:hypothetical protein
MFMTGSCVTVAFFGTSAFRHRARLIERTICSVRNSCWIPAFNYVLLAISFLLVLSLAPAMASANQTDNFVQSEGSKLEETAVGVYRLDKGEVLAHGRKPLEISTAHGSIRVRPGDIVLISTDEKMTRVLACYESALRPFHVVSFDKDLLVREGHEVTLTTETAQDAAEHLLAETNLRRRRLKFVRASGGKLILESEVSLLDASLKDQILVKLAHSDLAAERALADHIAKAAGSMSMLNDNEPYRLLQE